MESPFHAQPCAAFVIAQISGYVERGLIFYSKQVVRVLYFSLYLFHGVGAFNEGKSCDK